MRQAESLSYSDEAFKAPQRFKVEYAKTSRKVVQYELSFDREQAHKLQELKLSSPENYEDEAKSFEGFIAMQLLTALGERYNRGISEFSYRAKDSKLLGEHSDEPFEEVLKRGRDYRKVHGDPLDHPREDAEVVGFQKTQEVMASKDTPEGTVMISISPPGKEGSIYKHNFYDIYQKKADGTVRAIRYSSSLKPEETIMKLWEIAPESDFPTEATDVALLSSPIKIGSGIKPEQIHEYLHKEHEIMSEPDFVKVKQVCETLITSYIATLKNAPQDESKQSEIFNAILNRADDAADALQNKTYEDQFAGNKASVTGHDFYKLAYRPVRAVSTGCGFSGGVSLGGTAMGEGSLGAFGVSAFSTRPEDDPNLCRCMGSSAHFHCPGMKREKGEMVSCNSKIEVGKGITRCFDCGEMKKC